MNPWDKDPVVSPPSGAAPWAADKVVRPAPVVETPDPAKLAAEYTHEPPPPEAPPVAPASDRALRGLHVGAQGAIKGLAADFPTLPRTIFDLAASGVGATGSLIGGMLPEGVTDALSAGAEAVGNTPVIGQIPEALDYLFPTSEALQGRFGGVMREAGLGDLIIPKDEMSSGERIMEMINQFGAGAGAGSVGLAKSAEKAIAAGANAADLPLVSRPFADAVKSGTSGRTVFGDTAAGAGAGAGQGVYEENGQDYTRALGPTAGPIADAVAGFLASSVGGIGGGVGGHLATGTAKEIGSGVARLAGREDPRAVPKSAIDPKTGDPFSKLITDTAAYVAQNEASNPTSARANILDNLDDLRATEDFSGGRLRPEEMPTTGALSKDLGLAALEKAARNTDGTPFRERDAAQQRRIRQEVTDVAPQDTDAQNSRMFTDTFVDRAEGRRAAAAENVATAERGAAEFADQRRRAGDALAAEGGNKEGAAATIDKITSETLSAAQAEKNAKFDAIPGEERRSAQFLQDTADDVGATRGRLSDPAKTVPGDLLGRIRSLAEVDENGEVTGPGTVLVKELKQLRPEISEAILQARKDQNFILADNLSTIKTAISGEFAKMDSPEAKEALRYFAEEFGPVFARGPGDAATEFRKSFNQSRFERTSTPPSQTARTFIRPASPERAESLKRVLEMSGSLKEGQAAARQFILADLVSSGAVNPDGTLNRVRIGQWRRKWGEQTLDTAAPGLAGEVDRLASKSFNDESAAKALQAEIKAAKKAAGLTEQDIQNGALGFALGRDPVHAVADIFGSKDPQRAAAAVAKEIGDDETLKTAFKQSVRDWLLDTRTNTENGLAGGRPVSLAKLSSLFEKNVGALSEVFSPEEMNSLRRVHKLLSDNQIVQAANAVSGSQTNPHAENVKSVKRAVEAGLKLKFGVLKGGGIMRALNLAGESLPGNDFEGQVNRLLTQMALDPELAAHLLARDVTAKAPAWNKKLQNLIRVGGAVRSASEDDSEE